MLTKVYSFKLLSNRKHYLEGDPGTEAKNQQRLLKTISFFKESLILFPRSFIKPSFYFIRAKSISCKITSGTISSTTIYIGSGYFK